MKTINLTELATGFRSEAKIDSNDQRLQRFLSKFNLYYPQIARIIVMLINIPQPWILSLDRTEWTFGQTRFHIFMLGVVHQGVAYPLVWTRLELKGNSDAERMDLLETYRAIFPSSQIAYLCGDREFIAKEWLTYLMPMASDSN